MREYVLQEPALFHNACGVCYKTDQQPANFSTYDIAPRNQQDMEKWYIILITPKKSIDKWYGSSFKHFSG